MVDILEWRREAFETGFGDPSLYYDRGDKQEGGGEFPLKRDLFGQDEKGAGVLLQSSGQGLRGKCCQ